MTELHDPHFSAFADSLARLLPHARVRITLVDRSSRRYPDPRQHPMVRLAQRAQREHAVPLYRGKIVQRLLREEKVTLLSLRAKRALHVFDAALRREPIDLRAALHEAERQPTEWREAV